MGACCPKASAKEDKEAPPFTVVLASTGNPIVVRATTEQAPEPTPEPAPVPEPAPKPALEPVPEHAPGGAESPGSDDFEVVGA